MNKIDYLKYKLEICKKDYDEAIKLKLDENFEDQDSYLKYVQVLSEYAIVLIADMVLNRAGNIIFLKYYCGTVEDYNDTYSEANHLTPEEFKALKEYIYLRG